MKPLIEEFINFLCLVGMLVALAVILLWIYPPPDNDTSCPLDYNAFSLDIDIHRLRTPPVLATQFLGRALRPATDDGTEPVVLPSQCTEVA
jgi:hypothetical protein